MVNGHIPKELEYLAKIQKSKVKKMTKSAWCRYVDKTSGNRNKLVNNFITLGILHEAGLDENGNKIYKLDFGKMENYTRQSDFYKFLMMNKQVFGILATLE